MLLKQLTQKVFAITLAAMLIIPLGTLFAASEKGSIVVQVVDENNKPFIGQWALYQGPNSLGYAKRNGSKAENFNFNTGVYFIVANGKGTHRYTQVISANPQTLKENGKVIYKLQYFKTKAERDKVRAQVLATQKKAADKAAAKAKAEAEAKKKAEEAAKKVAKKTKSVVKKSVKKTEPIPEYQESNKELAKQKEELRKKRMKDLAIRQKAAQIAREKAGSGNVANAAQRKAEENKKALAAKKAQKKAEKEKKSISKKAEKTEEMKKAEAKAAAKVAQIKKRAAGKAKAEAIRMAAKKRREAEVKAFAESKKVAKKAKLATVGINKIPQLAATGNPVLLGLMLPSLIGGFIFRRRK